MISLKSLSASKISRQLASSRTLVNTWDTYVKLSKTERYSIETGKPAYELGKDTGKKKRDNVDKKRNKYFNSSKK